MIISHDNVAVDIDQDGIKDIVSLSNHKDNPRLVWYKIPENYKATWEETYIGEGIHAGMSPAGFGDLDDDGDVDIVRGNAWYRNVDGKGKSWEKMVALSPPGGDRPGKFGLALRAWCFDIDNDGDLDIIESEADTEKGRVYWFENINKAETFIFHPISSVSNQQDYHSLNLADFDGDGDQDVSSGGGPLNTRVRELYIWENVNGDGSLWKENKILEGYRFHETQAADIDNDGDIDLCTKPWHGDLHIFLENKRIK